MVHPAFRRTAHRPWPLPTRAWSWRQSWCDLLFAHWPIEAEAIRHLVPRALEIDQFNGTTWIGVVPFRMTGVMLRPFPDLPCISAFAELNLRLYVKYQGKPGVWFLSLDAANGLAVWAARRWFHLPYYHASMSIETQGERFVYSSKRYHSHEAVTFQAEYAPTGAIYETKLGSLEHWLTERYCLYAQSNDAQIYRADVHHVPWPMQLASADILHNDLFRPHGLNITTPPTLCHFAKRVDVVVWGLEKVL